jgi:tetratricopeptide (TPR) repeat protein
MATKVRQSRAREAEANRLYQRADKLWSRGRIRSAFRLFLAAAKAGTVPAFRIVGQFYDRGDGVKANQASALYWYRRAYRHGSESAANNIGCIWRDRGKLDRAVSWLKRAVKLGDNDANLNIAKIYLRTKHREKAIHYLNKACKSRRVTEGSKEEAKRLLKDLKGPKASRGELEERRLRAGRG